MQPWELDLGSSIPTLPFGLYPCSCHRSTILPARCSRHHSRRDPMVLNHRSRGIPALPPPDHYQSTGSFCSSSLLPPFPPLATVPSFDLDITSTSLNSLQTRHRSCGYFNGSECCNCGKPARSFCPALPPPNRSRSTHSIPSGSHSSLSTPPNFSSSIASTIAGGFADFYGQDIFRSTTEDRLV